MKAMILAAGEGTRLKPLTIETPKALLPIGGVPLIVYTLTWLGLHDISEVAINLCHLGDKIKLFVGNGSQFGIKVVYSEEKSPLGTAGGVKKIAHLFDGPFVVFYGDNLTDFDLSAMISFHQHKKAMATIAAFKPSNPSQVGIIEMDESGRICRLIEKPQNIIASYLSRVTGIQPSGLANAAVYVLEPEVLGYIKNGEISDFAYDIFPKLIDSGAPIYGYQLESDAYFIDIGTMENYQQANEDRKAGKVRVEI